MTELMGNQSRKALFEIEHWRNGIIIGYRKKLNIIPNEGLDDGLDVEYSSGTQITAYYCALVESNTSEAAGMTYAVPVYTESTAYSEGTRPAWTEAGVSGQSVTNSASKATFTMSASKTIYGGSLVGGGTDADTKGDTAGGGVLKHYALLGAPITVVSADVLKLTITINASDV